MGPETGVSRVSFHTENSGYGVGRAVSAGRKLIEQECVDLVVGVMNPRAVRLMHELFESTKTVLVAASAGECMATEALPSTIFHCSLNGWQSHRAMGEWAGRAAGRRAAVIASFSQSGYDLLPAFRRGFEERGGAVVSTHIVDAPAGGVSIGEALAAAAASQPDLVYALFSDTEVDEFLRSYAASPMAGTIPLLGSAGMVEAGRAQGITTCMSWAEQLRTLENRQFVEACRKSGRSASTYMLLGYDTASLIVQGLAASGGDPRSARFVEGLRTASFSSPRGQLAVDPQTQSVVSPLYLRRSTHTATGVANRVLAELPPLQGGAVADMRPGKGGTAGWLHSSLVV